MEKKIEVVGVTNMPDHIANLLGVKDETEYGLYQETAKGKYFAKRLSDGTLDPAKVVRLLSDEQAAELEAELCAMIDGESAKFSEITQSVPVIDPKKIAAGASKIASDAAEKIQATIGKAALIMAKN